MKFGTYLDENQICEWKEFYINYEHLKKLIKPFQKYYKLKLTSLIKLKKTKSNLQIEDCTLEESLLQKNEEEIPLSNETSIQLKMSFQEQLLREFKKIEFFLDHNFKYYDNRIKKISEQLEYIKLNKQYKEFKDKLEEALKELYKELFLMKGFIEINFKAKIKILKKYKKVTKYLDDNQQFTVEKTLDEFLSNSEILNDPIKILTNLISQCEKNFYLNFFEKYSFSVMKILKDYIAPVTFTQQQAFYLGFFVGVLVILLSICLLISRHFDIDMDIDVEFNSIFPMFRAFGIICMYLWILGLNVWAWNNANINYKLVFNFKNHYSDVISIFKRAAIFSTLLVTMILCYLIIRTQIPFFYQFASVINLEYTPLICWVTFLIYLFFPFKDYFNYQGRIYTFKLLCESVASIYIATEFRHIWFMDQLTSFIGPMRDIEYTMCYYAYYDTPLNLRKELCTKTRVIVLLIGVFPHLIRILQCIRLMIDSKVYPQIINAGKYLFAIIVAIFSFLLVINPIFYTFWWIFAIVSAFYSSYWDLYYDFGFMQKGEHWPLRDKLSYKNKLFYYFVIVTDLFLRFVWIVSVSPEIISGYIHPEFLSLLIYSLEVFRRGMWNFVRVELQHLQACKEFKVTVNVELPFKKVDCKFVLKDVNAVDLVRMNRRIQKMNSRRLSLDLAIKDIKDFNLIEENSNRLGLLNTNDDKKYENTEFRNEFSKYIKEYNENEITAINIKSINGTHT